MAKRSRTLALLATAAVFAAACSGTGASTAPEPSVAAGASAAPVESAAPGALPTPEKTDIKIGLSVTETSQFAAKLAELVAP